VKLTLFVFLSYALLFSCPKEVSFEKLILLEIGKNDTAFFNNLPYSFLIYSNNNSCFNCYGQLKLFMDSNKIVNYIVVMDKSNSYLSNLQNYKIIKSIFYDCKKFYFIENKFLNNQTSPLIIYKSNSDLSIFYYKDIFDSKGNISNQFKIKKDFLKKTN